MIYDLQKGSLLKRISAFILDGILLVIIAVGFAFALSSIFHYSTYSKLYSDKIDSYAEQFDVDFEKVVSQSEYEALSDAERARYDQAVDALNNDTEILGALNVIVRMIIAMVSVSLFLAFMVIEFIFPMIFKNGQTPGKKIFGLAVMRTNGVRIRGVSLFIRTFLGKYVVETMIPVLIGLLIIFNAIGIMGGPGILGLIMVLILFVAEIVLVAVSKTNSMIHDFVSDTVVVDMASQMIFDDEKSMIEYKQRKAAEEAAKSPY